MGGCAARGPAAITHQRELTRRQRKQLIPSLCLVWRGPIPFAFFICFINFTNEKQRKFNDAVWGASLLSWLVAVRLLPPITNQSISPLAPLQLPLFCRASCFALQKLSVFSQLCIRLGGRKPATHHNSSARPLGRAS